MVFELKAVFPPGSPIHLGHDEVSAEAWKNCRYCQNRLKSLREKDLKALSRDFLQRIADYVRKGGYEAIVWDEAGELEADKRILVMAWRGNGFAAAAESILYFGALIAVNLAVMNLLPLPALDGGKEFILVINTLTLALFTRQIPPKYENYIHMAGFALLMALMLFITFHDVMKLL